MTGIYSMYLHCHFTMQKQGHEEDIGEHQAVFQLANAMQTQLNQQPGKGGPSDLTEQQLRRRITKDLNGGCISSNPPPILLSAPDIDPGKSIDTRSAPPQFRTYVKKEMWWLVFAVLAFAAVCASVVVTEIYALILLFPLELPFAMYVSQSRRSRWVLVFLLFWFFAIRGVVPAVMAPLFTSARKSGYE